MKTWILIFILFISIISACNISNSTATVKVINALDGKAMEGVTLKFFPSSCYSNDIYFYGYNYSTCNGKYDAIPSLTTNSEGLINLEFTGKYPPLQNIRFSAEESDKYLANPTWGFTNENGKLIKNPIIRLIPSNAPLNTEEKAIDFAMKTDEIKNFNKTLTPNRQGNVSFYGVWRTVFSIEGNSSFIYVCIEPDGSKYRFYEDQISGQDCKDFRPEYLS